MHSGSLCPVPSSVLDVKHEVRNNLSFLNGGGGEIKKWGRAKIGRQEKRVGKILGQLLWGMRREIKQGEIIVQSIFPQ